MFVCLGKFSISLNPNFLKKVFKTTNRLMVDVLVSPFIFLLKKEKITTTTSLLKFSRIYATFAPHLNRL